MYAPGLKGQVELFRLALRGRAPSAGALYLIATGANDYRDDQYNVPLQADVVVSNIGFALRRLYQLGARTLLVAGLPDLGRLPFADPAASELTDVHNTLLRTEIATLSAQMPDARFIFVDINDAFRRLPPEMNPTIPALAVYGSQLPTPDPGLMTCLFTAPSTCRNVPMEVGAGFAFWDIVHPTTAAHQVLGALLFEHLP
jgi:phospholipase/lecithinase/hemolysin